MSDVFDYFNWRGDLTLEKDGFNDVDALILSRLSYLPFDGIVPAEFDKYITVYDAADVMFSRENEQNNFLWDGDADLLKYAACNPRFADMKLSGYINIVEPQRQIQFCALIITLEKDRYYISFRGTDNSIVGWQEDFNMYYMFPLPSQKKSVEYLEQACRSLDGTFILGGHSKGGNLAVYASIFCKKELRQRIELIYNHDGPGFDREVIKESGFEAVKNKIRTYVPQSSIFGMMFEHEEDFTIIKSNQKGFLQHDIYSWEIRRTRLEELNRLTGTSLFFDHTIKQFAAGLTVEQRKEFIEGVFSILENTEDKTFDELGENFTKNYSSMLKTVKNMDSKTRKLILSTLLSLIKCAKNNFSDILPKKQNRTQKRIPEKN